MKGVAINKGNVRDYAKSLTNKQLNDRISKVRNRYQGEQIRMISDNQFDAWCEEIDILEEERESRREKSK